MSKLYSQSREAIFFFNHGGRVLYMNPAAEKIVDNDVLKQLYEGHAETICRVCRGYMSETELRTCIACYFTSPESERFSSFQVYLDTVGKGVIPYAASYHTLDETEGVHVLMLRDLSQQFKTQESFYQNKMMKHVIHAQENERRRISRELHDSVAQELMSAVIDLRVLKYMTGEEELLKKMRQTEESMTRLLDDIRNLAVELRPAALDDFGLEAAFRSHFKRIKESYGFAICFDSNLDNQRYGSEVETVIYRIGQEAILNALKYAEVDILNFVLREENGHLRLMVEDKGKGFDPDDDPIGTGLGLYGMQERAELVGGRVSIHSEKGKGTRITLDIPVPEQAYGGDWS
ncbi:sensor histidine kinase [Paenibacillus sp. WLX1005]|uniref:sensor histidine kinase n=1 Tax=Paenibacillus sp. WLX1005 TaxID=3243766 RepID=UPI00398418AD